MTEKQETEKWVRLESEEGEFVALVSEADLAFSLEVMEKTYGPLTVVATDQKPCRW